MKKKFVMIAVFIMMSLAAVSTAEVTITTAIGNGADGGVSNDGNQGPNVVLGTATNVNLRHYDTVRAKAVILRFDISTVAGDDLSDAVLSITTSSTANRGRTINIYGLIDGPDDLWDESALCYNTAPGLIHEGETGYTFAYINIDSSKWSLLGTMPFAAAPATNTGPIDLTSFIAADTNGVISLLLYTSTSDNSQSWYCDMKEYYPTYPMPALTFPHAIPVGSSYPQPEDGSTITDLNLSQLCWKNKWINRYKVWLSPVDANETNYQSLLTPICSFDLADPNLTDLCMDIPAGMLPLENPAVYTWAVEGYVYSESDPGHTGEPNELLTASVWQFFTTDIPALVSSPEDQYKFPGESASFAASFEAISPVTGVTWYKVGDPDTAVNPADSDVTIGIIDEGDNQYTVTLTIDNLEIADDGAYYCIAQNGGPSKPSEAAYLVIKRMLAHWDFNGDAEDETGVYNGTLMGEPNFVTDGTRQALQFDGVDDYVDLPDGFANFRSGLTFTVWADPLVAANYARFIDLGNGAPSDNIFFTRAGTGSWLHFELYTGTVSGGYVSLGGGTLVQNEWQLLAVTLDETGHAVLYKNGLPIANSTIAIPNVVTRTSNFIGQSNWTADALYNGLIDDMQVYNYTLTEDAIAQMYADAVGDFCRFRPAYDYNNNCIVDLGDLATVATQWLQCGIYPETACP